MDVETSKATETVRVHDGPARSWDTSIPTLIVSMAAVLLLRSSGTVPGISDIERRLASAIVPLLLIAGALAVAGVVASFTQKHGRAGFFGVLSIILINMAGLLAGQYGEGRIGLLVTLLVTSPIAVTMARRETAWRRTRGHHFA